MPRECGFQIKASTSVATAESRMMKRLTMPRMRPSYQALLTDPVNGVRCHCVSVWVGNLYSYSVGSVAGLVMETCPRIYLCASQFCVCVNVCVCVANVKLIYNFPASHFNFSCCEHCVLFALPFHSAPPHITGRAFHCGIRLISMPFVCVLSQIANGAQLQVAWRLLSVHAF